MKTKNNIENLIKKALEESLSKGDSPITEATLSKAQLDKREDIIKDLKKNKKELVKRYGKDAEAVMYGRATNLAKKAVSEMNKEKLKELVRKSLMNEADIETMADKIGGEEELSLASNLLDDFESKLKSHDWYYMMSDDNRAYTKGSAEESELKKIAKQLSDMGYGGDAAKIFNKYNVFKNNSFSSFITPPEPFIPMYKRKQMGLDETEFSKEFDNDPALKGSQKKLPDALQKAIIKKEKGVKEDQYIDGLGTIIGDPIDMGKSDPATNIIKSAYSKILDLHRALINTIAKTYPEVAKDQKIVKYFNGINTEIKILKKYLDTQSKINEDIDLGHEDNEPHMIKGELYQIGKYAMDLYAILEELEEAGGEYDFPAWWQSKITTAKNMMSGAKHYLDFELKEPAIDAAVDALTGEEPHEGEPMMEASRNDINFVNTKWNSIKDKFDEAADAQGLEFNVYYYDNKAPFPSIWPGKKNYGPADDRGVSFPDPDKEQNLISNFNSILQSIGVNDLVAKQSKTYPAILMPKSPMMENIGKDEMLAARLYKIKNQVQPAFYQKVRMMINNGDLEKAEEFISRIEPVAAKKDTEFAAMKGELDSLEEVKEKIIKKLKSK